MKLTTFDDLRGITDYTHELVMEQDEQECKESSLKMVIKCWPREATYWDRVRVTDWLLHRAQVEQQTKQEHGYYTASRRSTLSPVTHCTTGIAKESAPTLKRRLTAEKHGTMHVAAK